MQTGPSIPYAKAFDGPFFRFVQLPGAGVAISDIELLFETSETFG